MSSRRPHRDHDHMPPKKMTWKWGRWTNPKEQTLLMIEVLRSNFHGVTRRLNSAFRNINAQDINGDTALIIAVRLLIKRDDNRRNIFSSLLQAGANVNVQNKAGHTALMIAAQNGDFASVEALLQQRAAVNLEDTSRQTALHKAVQSELMKNDPKTCEKIIESLIEHKIDIRHEDENGKTALDLVEQLGPSKYESIFSMLNQKNGDT